MGKPMIAFGRFNRRDSRHAMVSKARRKEDGQVPQEGTRPFS
jgi:hypothetical protein